MCFLSLQQPEARVSEVRCAACTAAAAVQSLEHWCPCPESCDGITLCTTARGFQSPQPPGCTTPGTQAGYWQPSHTDCGPEFIAVPCQQHQSGEGEKGRMTALGFAHEAAGSRMDEAEAASWLSRLAHQPQAIPQPSAALIAAAPARERREPCSGAKTKAIQCSAPLRFLG